jgi:CTP-dependent riboflavin kinase
MRVLQGIISSRFGAAAQNLKTVEKLILERTGLPSMAPGTLNVTLPFEYIVHADTAIEPDEYFTRERLKLQRCRVRRHRMIIMRPDSHELPGGIGADVLELVSPLHLRSAWGLRDLEELEVEVEGDQSWWERPDPTD